MNKTDVFLKDFWNLDNYNTRKKDSPVHKTLELFKSLSMKCYEFGLKFIDKENHQDIRLPTVCNLTKALRLQYLENFINSDYQLIGNNEQLLERCIIRIKQIHNSNI